MNKTYKNKIILLNLPEYSYYNDLISKNFIIKTTTFFKYNLFKKF